MSRFKDGIPARRYTPLRWSSQVGTLEWGTTLTTFIGAPSKPHDHSVYVTNSRKIYNQSLHSTPTAQYTNSRL